jgi:diguanylate cyclase (GGDEF)-like protein/PAS domain S-box-containing protein
VDNHREDELAVLRTAVEVSPVAIFMIERGAMRVLDANDTACRSLGYTRGELLGVDVAQVVSMPARDALAQKFDAAIEGKAGAGVMWACLKARSGAATPVQWIVRVVPTSRGSVLVVVARGAARRPQDLGSSADGAAQRSPAPAGPDMMDGGVLSQRAESPVGGTDALTGLADRTRLEHRLNAALEEAARQPDRRFALLFVDFDGFKSVNDTYGHLAGDKMLREIAGRLGRAVRDHDTVARYGGDEFVVLLDQVAAQEDVIRVAERIRAQLDAPARVEDRHVQISASIGIALSWHGYKKAEQMLHDADRAMYRAKAVGNARYAVFGES